MKTLNAIFSATLLSIATGEILRIGIGSSVAFRLLDFMVFLSVSVFFLNTIFVSKKFPDVRLKNSVFVFTFIGLFSLLVNVAYLTVDQISVAGLYLLRWIMYTLSYFVVISIGKKLSSLIVKLLLAVGSIIVIMGYFQYFLYPNLRNLFYLGWDEHNYRMFSVFLDPNFAGSFFVLFFVFVAHQLRGELAGNKHRGNIALYGVLSIITFIAVFLTYSRSAFLMLLVSSFTYLILAGRKKFLAYFLVIISLVLLALLPTFNKDNTNLLRRTSSIARVESYTNALKLIEEHPLLGVGFNAYRYAQLRYGLKVAKTGFPNHADAGADSSILFVWATTGIVGLIAYLYMWMKIVELGHRKADSKKSNLAIVLLSSVAGVFVSSLFINSLFYPVMMLWMWVLVGLVENE